MDPLRGLALAPGLVPEPRLAKSAPLLWMVLDLVRVQCKTGRPLSPGRVKAQAQDQRQRHLRRPAAPAAVVQARPRNQAAAIQIPARNRAAVEAQAPARIREARDLVAALRVAGRDIPK